MPAKLLMAFTWPSANSGGRIGQGSKAPIEANNPTAHEVISNQRSCFIIVSLDGANVGLEGI